MSALDNGCQVATDSLYAPNRGHPPGPGVRGPACAGREEAALHLERLQLRRDILQGIYPAGFGIVLRR